MTNTIVSEVQGLTEKYIQWIKDNMTFNQVEEWVEVTTNYLDMHNDSIQIYIKKEDDHYLMTDDGFVKSELFLSGLNFQSDKQKQLFDSVMKSFGIYEENDALYKKSKEIDFPFKFHVFVQGLLSLLDLFYIAKPQTKSMFYEEILNWFSEINIPYTERIKIEGKSGFDHTIDFVFPKTREKKERLAKIIGSLKGNNFKSLLFMYEDIKAVRKSFEPILFINDQDDKDLSKEIKACQEYNILPVCWSKKEEYLEEINTVRN